MDSVVTLVLAVALVVMAVGYLVDVRIHPDAGGGRLRWSLRWCLTVVAAVLLAVVSFDTSSGWFQVGAMVLLLAVLGAVYRGLGTGRRPRDRSRARYRSVRERGTGVDGWRGD